MPCARPSRFSTGRPARNCSWTEPALRRAACRRYVSSVVVQTPGVAARILLVGGQDPASPPSGGKLRFDATVRGLAAVGSVDYLQWKGRGWHRTQPARSSAALHELPLARHEVVGRRTLP